MAWSPLVHRDIQDAIAPLVGTGTAFAPAPSGGDDRVILNNFLAGLPANVGRVKFPPGTYIIGMGPLSGGLRSGLVIPRSNMILEGSGKGATVFDASGWASPGRLVVVSGIALLSLSDPYALSSWVTALPVATFTAPVAKYANTVTVSPVDAAGFAAGDTVFIRTGQNNVAPDYREPNCELNEVLSVDTSSGVISLRHPTTKPYVQEYDIGDGSTSSTGGGAAFPFGITKVTDRVIRNIGFRDLTFVGHAGAGAAIFHLMNVWGLDITDCNVTAYDYSILAARYARDVIFARNRGHRAFGLQGSPQTVGPSTGCSHWLIEDNLFTGYLGRFHAHEGVSAYTVRGNQTICTDVAADDLLSAAISVRGRAYDHRWEDNDFVGAATTACDIVVVNSTCDDGGIIRGNRFRSPGSRWTISVQGAGWMIENNIFPANWTASTNTLNTWRSNFPRDYDRDVVYRVVRTTDLARASTVTVADDPTLTVALPKVARTYRLRAMLIHDGDTAADLLVNLTRPTGSTLNYVVLAPNIATAASPSTLATNLRSASAVPIGLLGVGTKTVSIIDGTLALSGTAAGNLTIQWAQNASSATPTTLYTGSYLELAPMDA